ncbi:hypothetical protein [Xanthomonas citri]|uniref:hypothetical protein n=1 Tax=Xanthomonas citri TaxID=346 RepID=UPI0010406BB6|nr:hypothetical protein [Xanthomonas citri]
MLNTFTRRHSLDFEPRALHYQHVPLAFRLDFLKLLFDKAHAYDNGMQFEYRFYRMLSITINQDYHRFYNEEAVFEGYSSDLLVDVIQRSTWHQVLSMLEASVNDMEIKAAEINRLLAYHQVGYELIREFGTWHAEVKYQAVIEEMDKAIEITGRYPKINSLIKQARKDLADPQNIQVENSVKNSIQAVEGFMINWIRKYHGLKCSTLGEVVKEIKKKNLADSNIIDALHQFYIYRNRTPNIGHGSTQDAEVQASDALLINDMAISYINYFGRRPGGSVQGDV